MILAPQDSDLARMLIGSAICICAISFAVFCRRLYKNRMLFRNIRKNHGVPMMPHSFLFGHLPALFQAMRKQNIPADLDSMYISNVVATAFPEVVSSGVIYLDVWPMTPPIINIVHPAMTTQVSVSPSLPKHSHLRENHLGPLTKGIDLISGKGDVWKDLRRIYSVGFSAKNITSMMPWFIEEVKVFKARLLRASETGSTIELEAYSLDLTLDIITRVTFGKRTRVQVGQEPAWIPALRVVMSLITFNLNLLKTHYPPSIYRRWRNNNIMRDEFTRLIHETASDYTTQSSNGPKTLVGLAVKPYVENGKPIPPDIMDSIIQNIKIFVLAGHDTTGTILARALYFLSKNPDKLALARAEHDAIFGPDLDKIENAILADYSIMNKLTYTMAVIKETLRLLPPVGGTVREATSPDFMLVNPDTGVEFPAHGFVLNPGAAAIGVDDKIWYKPLEFIPERFLVRDEEDPLYPAKHAWQPFGLGPRACLGQEIVYLEIRLGLAFLIRDLDFIPQYAAAAPTFQGQVAYAATSPDSTVAARTKGNLPVKVMQRSRLLPFIGEQMEMQARLP